MLQETTKKQIRESNQAAKVFQSILDMRGEEDQHKEMFYVMGLNSQNTVLFVDLIGIGTVNQVNPSIRECYRLALIKNAVSIIVCHNHPSGDTKPSPQDGQFTNKLKEAGHILDTKLLDHIIIGDGFFSFADRGTI